MRPVLSMQSGWTPPNPFRLANAARQGAVIHPLMPAQRLRRDDRRVVRHLDSAGACPRASGDRVERRRNATDFQSFRCRTGRKTVSEAECSRSAHSPGERLPRASLPLLSFWPCPPRLGLPRRLLHFHFLLACRAGPLGSLCFLCLRLLPLLRHDRSPDRFTETPIPYGPLTPQF